MSVSVLVDKEKISDIVKNVSDKINNDYNEEYILLGVLSGSVLFFSDLAKNLTGDLKFDFIKLSSYGDEKTSSGNVKVIRDLVMDVNNKNILVVEDIVDTGYTVNFLVEYLKNKGAKSVKFVTLLSKPSRREVTVDVDYTGLEIEDKFVVGYGLDYAEKYRNLPYIGILND